MEKNLERRQVLMGLMTKGYLEPALFNQDNKEEMLTAFDGDLFEEYMEKIVVCSGTEIAFHMKCGLILKGGV